MFSSFKGRCFQKNNLRSLSHDLFAFKIVNAFSNIFLTSYVDYITIPSKSRKDSTIHIFTSWKLRKSNSSYIHKLRNLGLFINIRTSRQDVFLEQIAHKICSCFQKF